MISVCHRAEAALCSILLPNEASWTSGNMRFIDVFAGCGGFSLGLLKAGWRGVLAVEKNPMAFETFKHNLIDGLHYQFDWPQRLPKKAMSCEQILEEFREEIEDLKGSVDLMVGGPPCQGFSTAGARDPSDPRNKMAEQYLELVKIVQPSYLVIENVSGFNSKFDKKKLSAECDERYVKQSYADYICSQLSSLGYTVSRGKVNCSSFGVPQNRQRYLIICSKKGQKEALFEDLLGAAPRFKVGKGLSSSKPVAVQDAIGDLETTNKQLIVSKDSFKKVFRELDYKAPDILSPYLRLMRDQSVGAPDSMRLPNHKPQTIINFIRYRLASDPGKSLSKDARGALGLKKHAITVLAGDHPSPTVTTLPDDIIHYSEPRILTARETARLQSFPDWFEFKGKYTTGGKARKLDCPRYTQIGNAVPPLLSEAIGLLVEEQIQHMLQAAGVAEK